MFGHTQGQTGFPHARAAGNDNEIGRLKPGRDIVNDLIAGGHTRNFFFSVIESINNLHAFYDGLFHGFKRPAQTTLCQPEDLPLRVFQEVFRLPNTVISFGHDFRGGTDQPAQQGLFPDDFTVVPDIRSTGHRLHQFSHVRRTADLLQLTFGFQQFGQGDLINHFIAVSQFEHPRKNGSMRPTMKVFFDDDLKRLVERTIFQQNGPEDGLLGIQVLRRQPKIGNVRREHAHR